MNVRRRVWSSWSLGSGFYLFIYVIIKEHFCRDCLWKFFAWLQRVSVTQRVPVLKSVIFVEGVFVAQGYVDFSVTAVSLATTLSLSVKVRLQITCMSSDRPLIRQALMLLRYCFFRGWSHVHCTRWARDSSVPYSEILMYFHSPSTNSVHVSTVGNNYVVCFPKGFFFLVWLFDLASVSTAVLLITKGFENCFIMEVYSSRGCLTAGKELA